ncbi:Transposase [Thermomonospora echinospora]|uniref:Transposase n=1 Tax=Thermomonospora echinospora TaxID=1992 RepID=A0A1H6DXW5_9ACTN|nr:Transposase [Thermomonospora echinospora]
MIGPLLAPEHWDGRKEKWLRREIVDAILYVNRTGCLWRQLPRDFPPWQTVYWHFARWEDQGVTERILQVLRRRLRRAAGRPADPSAAVMDSQSVKGADTVSAGTRGYDKPKRTNGRKRFIVTDTLGLLIAVMVRPAGVQDRAGATTLLLGLYLTGGCRLVFADQGLSGWPVAWARDVLGIIVHIVGKPAGQRGFQVHPKRWVAERTLAWLTAHRRLARDYERHPQTSEALIRWAAIGLLVRRLTHGHPVRRPGPRPLEYLG